MNILFMPRSVNTSCQRTTFPGMEILALASKNTLILGLNMTPALEFMAWISTSFWDVLDLTYRNERGSAVALAASIALTKMRQ